MHIVPMTVEHADAVLAIYQVGIDEGNATFETTAPDWPTFDAGKLPEHRFVAVDDAGTVLGWVAAVPVSDRCVYAGVVEHSVYVDHAARGRGVGRALLDALARLDRSRRHLDHPVRRLPRERREPRPAPRGRLPRSRTARTHRQPPRHLARRHPHRAPQPRRRLAPGTPAAFRGAHQRGDQRLFFAPRCRRMQVQ